MNKKKNMLLAMLCGMIGCLCYGGGDWLMMYGNPVYHGELFWLTDGVANISSWRNTLAMALAFPGIIFYGIALFSLKEFVTEKEQQKRYTVLTAFGLTPWLTLHILYVMILYSFAWLNQNGYAGSAVEICEALYTHFLWVIIVSEGIMLPPFIYWFWIVLRKQTDLPKSMSLVNPLVFYLVLYLIRCVMPECAFKLGFTNGLMSESMIICFAIWAFWILFSRRENVTT